MFGNNIVQTYVHQHMCIVLHKYTTGILHCTSLTPSHGHRMVLITTVTDVNDCSDIFPYIYLSPFAMTSAVETVLSRVLSASNASELDAPTLSFLASMIQEEVDFLEDAPGSLTGAQLLHLLSEKLEETLVLYELAKTEEDGRLICAQIVHEMRKDNLLKLAVESDDSTAGVSDIPSPSSLLAAELPRLSASVRLTDVIRAQAASVDPNITSMAAIQRHKTGWSAAEEAVLFQSLADSNGRLSEDDDEDEIVEEGGCEMCTRQMPLTKHHLIPRKVHKHGVFANMSKEKLNTCALICRPCHSAIHSFEDEKSLATKFNTIPLLMADPRVQKWVAYISKRKVNRTKEQASGKGLHYGR
jgi:hypothetical protein